MRKFVLLVIAVASFAMLASSERGAAENQFGDANAQPAPFNPQMAAMMSMLIQPRHAKLGLAGATDNWPLAGYMLKELRQGFVITARAVPRWKGLPVPDLFDAAVDRPLKLLEAAVKLQYKAQFDDAYGKLTEGCNACHATTEHPYVVIKVPDASAFPNQDFQPKR